MGKTGFCETSKAGHVHCCLSSHTMGRISPCCWHSDIITSQEISLTMCPMRHAHSHCSDSGIAECQGCSAAQWTAVGQGFKGIGQERWPEIPAQGERRHPPVPFPCAGKGHHWGWWHWDWGCCQHQGAPQPCPHLCCAPPQLLLPPLLTQAQAHGEDHPQPPDPKLPPQQSLSHWRELQEHSSAPQLPSKASCSVSPKPSQAHSSYFN